MRPSLGLMKPHCRKYSCRKVFYSNVHGMLNHTFRYKQADSSHAHTLQVTSDPCNRLREAADHPDKHLSALAFGLLRFILAGCVY